MAETYFGKTCARHPELSGERYRSNCDCLGCNKERLRELYRLNAEKIKEHKKAYRKANSAKIKAWREANVEKIKARDNKRKKEYRQTPEGKLYRQVERAKRRALKLQQTVPLTEAEEYRMKQIYEIARINGLHVDHIKPLAKGGLHHPDNLQLLKPEVNLRKGAKEIHPLFLWQLE